MARKLLCPAALLLALTLIFTGCSVKKVNNIPSSEQVSAFGDFKHYFGELNENEKRAYNAFSLPDPNRNIFQITILYLIHDQYGLSVCICFLSSMLRSHPPVIFLHTL